RDRRWWWSQPGRQLPGREAQQRHPLLDHRSRGSPGAQGQRPGGQALLLGERSDENRNGLIVDLDLLEATGFAEREAGLDLLRRQRRRGRRRRLTVAGDRGYDTRGFVAGCRELAVTPHLARNTTNRRSAIDRRTTRHAGYAVSQRVRKRVEEIFGWVKTVGGGRKLRYIGRERNREWLLLTGAAYN